MPLHSVWDTTIHQHQHPAPSTQGQRQHPAHTRTTGAQRVRLLARKPHVREHVRAVIGSNWNSGSLKSVYEPKSHHPHRKQHRSPIGNSLQVHFHPPPAYVRAHRKPTPKKQRAPSTPPSLEGWLGGVFGGVFSVYPMPKIFSSEPPISPLCNFLQIHRTQKSRAHGPAWWGWLGLRWRGCAPCPCRQQARRCATRPPHHPSGLPPVRAPHPQRPRT